MRGITLSLSLFAILAASVSGLLYYLIGEQKAHLAITVVELESALAASEARSTEVGAARDALAAQRVELARQLNEIKARSVSLEARNSQLARDISGLREELALREKLDRSAADEASDLRRDLVETKAALAAATAVGSSEAVAGFQSRISNLEAEVAYLRLHPGGGRTFSEALTQVPDALVGTVLEVGANAQYVVLNIGLRNGAVPSLEMVLRRGSTIVARVRLTDVRDSYSVAEVLPASGSGTIRAGDSASRS